MREKESDTDEKGEDESGENGKDGPDTEGIGEGGNPGIGIIVPEVIEVGVPEIGRDGKDGGHDHLIHSFNGGSTAIQLKPKPKQMTTDFLPPMWIDLQG